MTGLTVGLGLYSGQRPPGAPGRWYGDAPVLGRAAEEAGFDAFWVTEHHGWTDGYLPSPLPVLCAVAAVTDRIRLGTGLALAPLHHPVRLAEDAAVVDNLSGGRLVLGLGLGYRDEEYRAFGVDTRRRGARLEETVAVLRRAGTGERFTYAGATITLDDVRVTPRPVQSPLPIWLGGYDRRAVARSARLADGHLVGRSDPSIMAATEDVLRSELDPARADDFTLAVNVAVVVDDDAGHGASARAGFAYEQLAYERLQSGLDVYAGHVADTGEAGHELAQGSIDRYLQLAGRVDEVVDGLRALATRLDRWPTVHIVLRALFTEPDLARQLDRIALFGEQVLPRLRDPPPNRPPG